MNKLGVIVASIFMSVAANAEMPGVYLSTYSATSLYDRAICGSGSRGYLHRVCVVDAVAASTAAVFNSSFTVSDAPVAGTQNLTGTIDASEVRCIDMGVAGTRGLYIDQFGTAGITVLYDCYR